MQYVVVQLDLGEWELDLLTRCRLFIVLLNSYRALCLCICFAKNWLQQISGRQKDNIYHQKI